jgi:hypothetical protein
MVTVVENSQETDSREQTTTYETPLGAVLFDNYGRNSSSFFVL